MFEIFKNTYSEEHLWTNAFFMQKEIYELQQLF